MSDSSPAAPLVSVVITTYNRPDMLRKAIGTAIDQTYPNKEIIVVDDHSPTDPSAVIEEFAYPIRYFRQQVNARVSAARNRGVALASGDYIAFLDDDDLWARDKLEKQVPFFRDYDVCLCGVRIQNSDDVRIQRVSEVTRQMLRYGNHFCSPSGLMIKRQVIQAEPFDSDIPWSEDWELYFRLSANYRIGYCPEPLLLYYREAGHVSMVNEQKQDLVSSLEKRFLAANKHRAALGEYFYRRRIASIVLSFIKNKANRLQFIGYAIRRAGVIATLEILVRKLLRKERIRF